MAMRLLAPLACAALVACAAQSQNYDDKDWTVEPGAETGAWREVESLSPPAEQVDPESEFHSLRGVRQDLSMAPNAQPDTRCHCLDVVLGTPTDPELRWAGERPTISSQNMVIAVRSQGSECAGGPEKRRPSIQAVDYRGDDVIVVIEELGPSRPQARGAIIKRPGANGALYIRPANKSLPYAASEKGMCRVAHSAELNQQAGTP